MKIFLFNIVISLFVFSSCSPSELEYKSYIQYLNNEENGLVKSTSVNDVTFRLKYLPKGYLAYHDLKRLKNPTKQQEDSILKDYENSITFLLNVSPEKKKKQSGFEHGVITKDIYGIEAYKERALKMNFSMSDYIKLRSENGVVVPVLTTMENTYDLVSDKSIYIVFSKEIIDKELGDQDWEFVFEDELFETGVSVFTFDKDDIEDVPTIKHDLIQLGNNKIKK